MGTCITLLRRRSESPNRAGELNGVLGGSPGVDGDTNGVDARHVPITSWYEKRNARPLKVGGRLSGKSKVYKSDLGSSCSSGHELTHEIARTAPAFARSEGQVNC